MRAIWTIVVVLSFLLMLLGFTMILAAPLFIIVWLAFDAPVGGYFILVPFSIVQGVFFIPLGMGMRTPDPNVRPKVAGKCPKCGYHLRAGFGCSECGWGRVA